MRYGRVVVWRVLLATVGLVLSLLEAQAARPVSTTPQVRVVQDMHTAQIEQIRADRSSERLVTISADKTVKVWRLADLQLLRSIPLPAEPGPEGTPNALALTPDGQRVYVGGYTGWDWHGGAHLYVIDTTSGRITGTLGRFDGDVVTALDLSPDGTRLAVGLGRGGLRLIDATTGQVLHTDTEYAGPVTFLHHAPDGRLASTSADGCVRVYRPSGDSAERDTTKLLLLRHQHPKRTDEPQCTGGELGGVRFSPDGRWLAFGSRIPRIATGRPPQVTVLDAARDFTVARHIEAPDPRQTSLCCIAWSPDSTALYVNGDAEDHTPIPIYRVRPLLTGTPERWELGRQRITNMLPLSDGGMVFSTALPTLVRASATGQIALDAVGRPAVIEPANLDIFSSRNDTEALRISPDGMGVALRVPTSRSSRDFAASMGTTTASAATPDWLQLDLGASQPGEMLRRVKAADLPSTWTAARRHARNLVVETNIGYHAYRRPTMLNGRPVQRLVREESVWSWSADEARGRLALGTQWRLHLLSADGQPAPGWSEPPYLTAPAFHTAFSSDGRWVVAVLGDGTIRWFSVQTGQEVAGAFIERQGSEWVAWRADGYYVSSPQGDQYIGWLRNRDGRSSPDLVRAVQVERTLYRPDRVQEALAAQGSARNWVPVSRSTGLAALAVPQVRIESLSEASREVRFSVEEPAGEPVRAIGVYVDGIPLLGGSERRVSANRVSGRADYTVRIPEGFAWNVVRVEAETASAIGLDIAGTVRRREARPARGQLWVLAIGVETFDEFVGCDQGRPCRIKVSPLPNAPSDARVLARLLGQSDAQQRLFSRIHVDVLTEKDSRKPTKAAIMQALDRLQQVRPEDTVLVFLASHGFVGGVGGAEYYFLPADVRASELESIRAVADGHRSIPNAAGESSLLSASELADALRRVSGRRILVIDSCHSGAADGRSNPYSVAKRSASAQVAVLSASDGNELSYEHHDPRVPHGAFTHGLLQGLRTGSADTNRDGWLTLEELALHAAPLVRDNTHRLNELERAANPRHRDFTQTPKLVAIPTLQTTRLMARQTP